MFHAPQRLTGDVADGDADTVIPSGASITAAKEKRERLRKTTANGDDDFISLSLTKRDNYSTGPHPLSRLVREEDELGEGDDGELISMASSTAHILTCTSCRVRRIHQCSGEDCVGEKVSQTRGPETEGKHE